jgi:hypothetical protein
MEFTTNDRAAPVNRRQRTAQKGHFGPLDIHLYEVDIGLTTTSQDVIQPVEIDADLGAMDILHP